MLRVEENKEILKQLDPRLDRMVGDIDNAIRNYLLIDISKSLAVIADNLEKGNETDVKHREKKATHADD